MVRRDEPTAVPDKSGITGSAIRGRIVRDIPFQTSVDVASPWDLYKKDKTSEVTPARRCS